MGKEILAAIIRGDESETLRVVEPLHCTCGHYPSPVCVRDVTLMLTEVNSLIIRAIDFRS